MSTVVNNTMKVFIGMPTVIHNAIKVFIDMTTVIHNTIESIHWHAYSNS